MFNFDLNTRIAFNGITGIKMPEALLRICGEPSSVNMYINVSPLLAQMTQRVN